MRGTRALFRIAIVPVLLGSPWACRPAPPTAEVETVDDPWTARRLAMVERQIASRGVTDERVLAAMCAVPRHLYVPMTGEAQQTRE